MVFKRIIIGLVLLPLVVLGLAAPSFAVIDASQRASAFVVSKDEEEEEEESDDGGAVIIVKPKIPTFKPQKPAASQAKPSKPQRTCRMVARRLVCG